jgi:ATP-binding cassette, subfamily B, multidrug efflux pump
MLNSRLQKLGFYLFLHRRQVFLGIVALFIVNALGVYIPLIIKDDIDRLKQGLTVPELSNYVLLILLLSSIMWGIRMLSRVFIFGVGRQVEVGLKQNIFEHLLTLEPAYFAVNSFGDLMSRATSDVDNIRRLLGFAVLSLANIIFAYGLTLPAMLSIDPYLSVAALIVYPLMLILVQLFSGKLQTQQKDVQERLADLSELIQEDISGIVPIKIYAQEEQERNAFARKNKNLLQANLQLARTRTTLFPLVEGIANVSTLILLAFGSQAIARGQISIGEFVTLIIYVGNLVFPTALLGFTISTYQRGEVSIDRVDAILQAEAKINNTSSSVSLPLNLVEGKITARHLNYTYPGAKNPALVDVNFTIFPGETVAIVGPIGSGKSTLANCIPRLLNIESGQLFLDEWDVTKLQLADLRSAIACVPQESFLFSTTITNNIRYGNPTLEGRKIEEVARIAQIHPEIMNFPQQYETVVGERGITLSGGQRQRTSLARALAIEAPVVILDDALSSVDNQTATHILNNLANRADRKTVIFISHQLSAAANADRILVMDRGEIVQSGTHQELLQQNGLYQSLWQTHQLKETIS